MATTKQKKKHGAGSEGSFKACLLESFLCGVWSCYLKAFTEAKRLNKQQDLAWIFGQFQEPSKAKNKLREHKIRKAFELPAKHSLEAVVVLCLRGFGKKREVANL
jgi:hypothetical protein